MSSIESSLPSSEPSSRPRYTAPALDKGLAIIEFLAIDGRGHTQTEIAKKLGRSQSELYRMLACLEQHNYIQRGPGDERYRLTSKLFELAHAHPPTAMLIDLALPPMRCFAKQTDQSCHLVVHQSHQAVVIAQVENPGFVGVSIRPGRALVLHESVSGRVLAAFEPTDIQSPWLAGLKQTLSAKRHKELVAALAKIRSERHEICPSTLIDGILDLSVPVLDHRGGAAAALSVPCLVHRQQKSSVQRVIGHLHEAADEISRAIGCRTYGSAE